MQALKTEITEHFMCVFILVFVTVVLVTLVRQNRHKSSCFPKTSYYTSYYPTLLIYFF